MPRLLSARKFCPSHLPSLAVAWAACFALTAWSQAQTPPAPPSLPTAAQTDPNALRWMQGSPPPADKRIAFANGSHYKFPQFRWSFSNIREVMPTRNVSRGLGAVSVLPRAERSDLDEVSFIPLGKTEPMTWRQAFDANYTDGIVVLHKGKIVYERYAGALKPEGQHISMSVTKSFFGLMGEMLIAEGKLDEKATVASYVPELKDSAFGDATVRQVLDMRTGLDYTEEYLNPQSPFLVHMMAGGMMPRPPGYTGPQNFYEFMQTVKKQGEHGGDFAYKTVNTDVLGWIIHRVTGKSVAQNLSERIWSRLGAEQDAYFSIDTAGAEFAGGGLSTGLRDLARFGEMMRNMGQYNGQQVVPKAIVESIQRGGDKAAFPKTYTTLPGWSYRSMWWVSHNEHGAYSARGVHGQAVYIDPKAQMVIARYASFPMPNNPFNDPTTLPAFMAVAKHLVAKP